MRPPAYLVFGLWLLSVGIPLVAQTKYNLLEYIPNQLGDSLVFDNFAGGTAQTLAVAWPDTQLFKKQITLKRTESSGAFRLETIDAQRGWQIYLLAPSSRREFLFENPLQLLPPLVEHGASYTGETTYAHIVDGRKQGSGKIRFVVTVQGHDSSKTPLQSFGDCLVISTLVERTDPDGRRSGYELKEWYARNFGLVKMAGDAFNLDAKNTRTQIVKAAAMVKKAKINGIAYKWDTP